MSTKPQAKNNATRSAAAAEKRTGTPHEIYQIDGGWSFRPVGGDADAPIETKTEAQPVPASLAALLPEIEYRDTVIATLATLGFDPAVLEYPEAEQMVTDGFAAGRDAALVAGDINDWSEEIEAIANDEDDNAVMTWDAALAKWRADNAETTEATGEAEAEAEAEGEEELTTEALVERNKARLAAAEASVAAYRAEVLTLLEANGWRESLLEEPEPGRLLAVGQIEAKPASETAQDIAAWATRADEEDQAKARGVEPQPEAAPAPAPVAVTDAKPRSNSALERAARAALDAYMQRDDARLETTMDDLRAALEAAPKPAKTAKPNVARAEAGTPRGDTKHATVLALLRRDGGATNAHMQDATGWQPHTVRGFLAGLKKKGFTVLSAKEGPDGGRLETVYRVPAEQAAAAA